MKRIIFFWLIFACSGSVLGQSEVPTNGIKSFALLVKEYEEAMDFYVDKLGFELVADLPYGEGKRWVSVKAPGSHVQLVLSKVSPSEHFMVGKQSGADYPLFVLTTKEMEKTFQLYRANGVTFVQEPITQPWGLGAVFQDLYGNKVYLQSTK